MSGFAVGGNIRGLFWAKSGSRLAVEMGDSVIFGLEGVWGALRVVDKPLWWQRLRGRIR